MTDGRNTDSRYKIGMLGYAFLWLSGRPWAEPELAQTGCIQLSPQYVRYWKAEVSPDTWVHTRFAPNAFHRGMQRLAFGVRWYCMV